MFEEATMHHLDRALQEFESDSSAESEYQFEDESEADNESEDEGDYEASYESAGNYETSGDSQSEGDYEAEYDLAPEQESSDESEAVFDEIEEMEQAAALLEVQDEGELEQFLGGLIGKIRKKLGAVIPPKLQRALTDSLKKVARVALPAAGAAIGSFVAPGIGTALGGKVAASAGKMFGLELEGMSHEDQEFEVARRIVGLTAEAAKTAAQTAQSGTDKPPAIVAKDAVIAAARTHAPALAAAAGAAGAGPNSRANGSGSGIRRRSGRWYRRGRRIILVGL
jgi:hypothetical protein